MEKFTALVANSLFLILSNLKCSNGVTPSSAVDVLHIMLSPPYPPKCVWHCIFIFRILNEVVPISIEEMGTIFHLDTIEFGLHQNSFQLTEYPIYLFVDCSRIYLLFYHLLGG